MAESVIRGITPTGFQFEISEAARDDWDLIEDFVAIDDGNIRGVISASKRLLGEKGYNALREHCREGGRVRATKMRAELEAIFSSDALKKYTPSQG